MSDRSVVTELWRRLPIVEVEFDGSVRALSDGAAHYLGPGSASIPGRTFDDAFPLVRARRVGDDVRIMDPEPGAEARTFRVEWIPLADCRLALLIDVSDRERLRRECLSLTRLASAGKLLSGIVHEINNPLSGIVGYAQLLLMQDVDRDVRSAVEKIHGEAKRTSRIVRNLLNFSRRRKHAHGPVRLQGALEEALELKAHDLRVHNISVHQDAAGDTVDVSGDHHQLVQVFVNLITNAEQAMYAADQAGRLSFSMRFQRDCVELVIRDTGPGIPEELRSRVFEPFFTTKKEGEGTGLGLDLCRQMLEEHGARVELLHDTGGGAAFRLLFHPYDGSALPARDLRVTRAARIRGRRIVVVEDDAVCRALLVDAFSAGGNTVHAFDRSEPALRFLQGQVVDVVISDVHRPGLNGPEFLDRVRALDASLAARVVFLTGDALNQDLDARLKRAGNAVLAKPVDLIELFAVVARIVARPEVRQRELFAQDGDARA